MYLYEILENARKYCKQLSYEILLPLLIVWERYDQDMNVRSEKSQIFCSRIKFDCVPITAVNGSWSLTFS